MTFDLISGLHMQIQTWHPPLWLCTHAKYYVKSGLTNVLKNANKTKNMHLFSIRIANYIFCRDTTSFYEQKMSLLFFNRECVVPSLTDSILLRTSLKLAGFQDMYYILIKFEIEHVWTVPIRITRPLGFKIFLLGMFYRVLHHQL